MHPPGGLTALGSNVLNMGLIGGVGVYYSFRLFQKLLPKTSRGFLTASARADLIRSWRGPQSVLKNA